MAFWKNNTAWRWIILCGCLAVLFAASRLLPLGDWIRQFTDWVRGQGALGVVAFAGGYVLGTVLFFPGSLMTIAAGVAFGLGWGVVIALGSATAGAVLAFLAGRYVARGAVEKRAQQNERFRAIDGAVGQQGWKIVLLLRLSPLVPFNLSNYFFGLTKVRLVPYAVASFFGMVPGSFLYVYLGHIGKATLTGGGNRTVQEWVFLGMGLVATIVLSWYLARLARKALRARREFDR